MNSEILQTSVHLSSNSAERASPSILSLLEPVIGDGTEDRMGFGHQSGFKGTLIVQPGSQQSLPIPVAEPSVLEIGWKVDGGSDIEFSASFTEDSHNNVSELVPSTHGDSAKDDLKLEIDEPGRCLLLFKNSSGGFFSTGSSRKVTYNATINTKSEMAAHAEVQRLAQEKADEEERYKKACEEERSRRKTAEQHIAALFKTVDTKQHEASELLGSAFRKHEKMEALRQQADALEKSLKEEMERSGSLANEAAAENVSATNLRQENYEIARGFPITLEVSLMRATGLKSLNFTGDNPWCQCVVKPHGSVKPRAGEVSSCQTNVASNTLEPAWNETHEVDWRVGDMLEFHVYDKGTLVSKEEGKATVLASSRFFPHGFEGDLPITDLEDATLHVRIVPLVDKKMPAVHLPHWPITTARWSTEQVYDLGKEPGVFKHKALLLAGYNNPKAAVEALNSANIDIPKAIFDHGYCIVLHWEQKVQTHLLVYRSDALEKAAEKFGVNLSQTAY